MNKSKNIGILTSSRADFGKLKPVISKLIQNDNLNVTIFATGMHLQPELGSTLNEIKKSFEPYCKIIEGQNYNENQLKGSINILSYIDKFDVFKNLDYLVIHGDRVECIIVSIAAKLLKIQLIHIEGGELSGSIDDRIRHSITKFSDFHLVSNIESKKRVQQLGESEERIWITGSPEASIILEGNLPTLENMKERYNITFQNYVILTFHPVVGNDYENHNIVKLLKKITTVLDYNFIIIGCNSDDGFKEIRETKKNLKAKNIQYFESIRFEYYLTLLKNASFLIGNSSSFVREAPLFGVPSIITGSRQNKRTNQEGVRYVGVDFNEVERAIQSCCKNFFNDRRFGDVKSVDRVVEAICQIVTSEFPESKNFVDI